MKASIVWYGNFLVHDRDDFSMWIVTPTGTVTKKFARTGNGPGELKDSYFSWRCGMEYFVSNNYGSSFSVFALNGDFVRTFRFAPIESPRD